MLMGNAVAVEMGLPIIIPPELRPFIGHSNLVALVRTKKIAEINNSFQEYIKKAIYQPLIVSLKTDYPDKYRTAWGFYGDDCSFLTPSHRQFCLMIFVAVDSRKKPSLQFYLYHLQENKLYNWTYFELYPHHEKHDYDIILRIFSPISQLDSLGYINNLECNFDDDDFWNNYVFKKENGKYLYLTESPRSNPAV